jgi:hypothetical protein
MADTRHTVILLRMNKRGFGRGMAMKIADRVRTFRGHIRAGGGMMDCLQPIMAI